MDVVFVFKIEESEMKNLIAINTLLLVKRKQFKMS
jgi:hypothetical protein